VEPLVPLTKVNELVFEAINPILIENLVNGSSKPFWISVWQFLIVVEKNSCVVMFMMQWLEIFCVVRQKDGVILTTPLDQVGVTRMFAKPVFCLFDIVSALSEKSLENPTNMFVEQNPGTPH
jgi:hypothetical protein